MAPKDHDPSYSKQEVTRVFQPVNVVKLSEKLYQTRSANTQQFLNVKKLEGNSLHKTKSTSISFTVTSTLNCTGLSTDCTVQPIAD